MACHHSQVLLVNISLSNYFYSQIKKLELMIIAFLYKSKLKLKQQYFLFQRKKDGIISSEPSTYLCKLTVLKMLQHQPDKFL